jgi:hypothetical protein
MREAMTMRLRTWGMALRWGEAGQGTVEYVGLVLLIAGVIAAVVAVGGHWDGAHLAKAIVGKLETAVDGVGSAK